MKTLKILSLFLGVAMFTSCGSDLGDDLVGDWIINSIVWSGCDDDFNNDSIAWDSNGCMEEDGETVCTTMTFSDNGNISIVQDLASGASEFSITSTGTYVADGDNLTITIEDAILSGTATIENDRLSLIGTDSSTPGCTMSLTASVK